jgi:hypothetical protein
MMSLHYKPHPSAKTIRSGCRTETGELRNSFVLKEELDATPAGVSSHLIRRVCVCVCVCGGGGRRTGISEPVS